MDTQKALVEQAATEVTMVAQNLEEMLKDGRIDDRELEQLFEQAQVLRAGAAKCEKIAITEAKTRHEQRYGYDAPMPEHIRRRVCDFERNQAHQMCKAKAASVLPKAA